MLITIVAGLIIINMITVIIMIILIITVNINIIKKIVGKPIRAFLTVLIFIVLLIPIFTLVVQIYLSVFLGFGLVNGKVYRLSAMNYFYYLARKLHIKSISLI